MRKSFSGNSVPFDLVSKIWIFWLEIAPTRRLRATCGFHHSQAIVEEIPKSQKEIQEISSAFMGCKENGQRSTLFILELKPMPSADGSLGNLDYKRAGRVLEGYLCI